MLYDPKWSPPETEVKLEEWQKLLLKAADIIEKEGWAVGACHNGKTGGFCLVGAMVVAARSHEPRHYVLVDILSRGLGTVPPLLANNPTFGTAVDKLQVALDKKATIDNKKPAIDKRGGAIWYWNDMKDRTKKQVISKLREVANAV